MSLFSSLTSASNALMAIQDALNVTQNNVANASTAGYARQVPTFEAQKFVPGSGEAGGVASGPVISARNEFAEANVRTSTAQVGFYEQRIADLAPVTGQFDISGNSGIPARLNELFTAFSTWAQTPNDATARQSILEHGSSFASAFRTTAANISQIAQSSDHETSSLTSQVNDLAAQIATYNQQIAGTGQLDAGTDAAVNSTLEKLSQVASVLVSKQANGTFDVMLGGQTQLVSGAKVNNLTASVYVPTRPFAASGHAVTVPASIKAGVNDALNLKVDGASTPLAIKLSAADHSLSDITTDINTQLKLAGSSASASADAQGRLVITSGLKTANAAVDVLSGSANSTLGLSVAGPPHVRIADKYGTDITASVTSGKLAASIQNRNQVLSGLQGDYDQTGDLNRMAKTFADRVNSVLGIPLFTYDQTNATKIAATLQVNPTLSTLQLPSAQVVSLTGVAVPNAFTVSPGVNDSLKLQIDGGATSTLTLNPADTTLTAVASDLNQQFAARNLGAHASLNANTGALQIQTTNNGIGGSIKILSATANSTLGMSAPMATYQIAGTSVTGVANPFQVTAGVNDQVNLKIDGGAPSAFTLNPADMTLADVASDLNTQFTSRNIGAQASLNAATGALQIQTTNTTASASMQLLPGTANATLALGTTFSSAANSFAITTGVNDQLSLQINGGATSTLTLNTADTTPADVVSDLNTQFASQSIGAHARLDPTTGGLQIQSTNTVGTGSVNVLAATANGVLGLSAMSGTSVTGVAKAFTINVGVNDKLSLQVDGATVGPLTLNPADTTLAAVASDLNTQFTSGGIGAHARLDPITGALQIQTTNSGPSGSLQLLAGTANSTLGLSLPALGKSLTGAAGSLTVTPGVTDKVNLQLDGTAVPTLTLDPADTTLAEVASDLNSQFSVRKIGAYASLNATTGALQIQTTNTGPGGSVQILPGTANGILGMSAPSSSSENAANAVALGLAALANPSNDADRIDGQSYLEFFGSIASGVGSHLATAKDGHATQQDLLTQAQSLRQQASGVDLNEEATRVLQLQTSYQAASRMMSVIDSMTQALLNIIS